uniref:Uncharacterized protein n=1 Tax=viral metagenome TaxID=1070528 RepID=A0A6H1ZHA3_9ZZZZ
MNHEFDDDCPCAECARIWDEAIAVCMKQGCLRIVDIGPQDVYYRRKAEFIGRRITNASLEQWPGEEWEHGEATLEDGGMWCFHQVKTE